MRKMRHDRDRAVARRNRWFGPQGDPVDRWSLWMLPTFLVVFLVTSFVG